MNKAPNPNKASNKSKIINARTYVALVICFLHMVTTKPVYVITRNPDKHNFLVFYQRFVVFFAGT